MSSALMPLKRNESACAARQSPSACDASTRFSTYPSSSSRSGGPHKIEGEFFRQFSTRSSSSGGDSSRRSATFGVRTAHSAPRSIALTGVSPK